MLFVAALAGCGTTQSYVQVTGSGPVATIELHRKAMIVSGGGDVYVLDDGEELPPNAIIQIGTVRILGVSETQCRFGWLSGPEGPKLLFGKDPEGSWALHDRALGTARSKELEGGFVLRRTTVVGTVRRGETLAWTRPPGSLRVAALQSSFGSAAPFFQSEWIRVEAGKRYRIEFARDAFTVEELR